MSPRILVIDPDSDIRLFLKLTLQPYGHQIIDASDVSQGLNAARREGPDLIILEPAIGGGTGFDLCRRLRMLPGSRPCPIVILSHSRQREDIVRGLEAGANDYITKPANPVELVARIHALIGFRQIPRPVVILVIGSKEGVGSTTIAVNLGVALAHHWQEQVVLIDAEIPGGDPAVHLGLEPQHNLADLISYETRVDADLVEGVICKHSSGLRLIAGSTEEMEPPGPDFLSPILEAMTGRIEYVIIDCEPVFGEEFMAVSQLADHVLVVATPELPALLKADMLLGSPSSPKERKQQAYLILNQANRRGGIPVESMPGKLRAYPLIELPYDPGKVLPSVNTGEPLVLRLPRSTMSRRLVKLASSLRRVTEGNETQPEPSSGIRALLRRLQPSGRGS
jgi:pilus assembly protein CpaE